MATLNKCNFIGRVGNDPEIRQFEGGNKVANIRLAVSETYTDRSGQRKEQTEWLNIVLGGKHADLAQNFIRKGSQIYVECKYRNRMWEDQNGQKHYQAEFFALGIQLLDARPQTGAQATPNAQFSQPTYSAPVPPVPPTPPTPPVPPRPQGYQPPYGAVATPPAPPTAQQLDPNNYPGDLPF